MSEQIKQPKAVIFDLNGTLLDMRTMVELDQHVGRRYFGRELTDDDITSNWGTQGEVFYPAVFGMQPAQWRIGRDLVLSHSPEFPRRPFPGVLGSLALLRNAGIETAIVTGGPRSMVTTFMEQAGLPEDEFLFVHTRDETDADVAAGGPLLGPALTALAGRNILASEILVVGDEPNDMRAAREAGIDFVAVTSGFVTAEQHQQQGVPPNRIIAGVHELPALFGIAPPQTSP